MRASRFLGARKYIPAPPFLETANKRLREVCFLLPRNGIFLSQVWFPSKGGNGPEIITRAKDISTLRRPLMIWLAESIFSLFNRLDALLWHTSVLGGTQ